MITPTIISMILLNSLFIPESNAENSILSVSATDVSCYGAKDGSIQILVSENTSKSFAIEVRKNASKTLMQFNENSPKPFHLTELEAGSYTISYISGENSEKVSTTIESPELLKANIITIESISGENESLRASIKANPTGGTLPYNISWSENTNNQKGEVATDLPLGIYRCTVNDANNCGEVTATIFLYESEIESYQKK